MGRQRFHLLGLLGLCVLAPACGSGGGGGGNSGSAGPIELLKDIRTRQASSAARRILYIPASDGIHGNELFRFVP